MTTNLEQAVVYIKAGDLEKGKKLLIQVIQQNPRDENAWLWMSRCVTSVEQKRECFQRALNINPDNPHAVKGLHRLDIAQNSQSNSQASQPIPSQVSPQKTRINKSNLGFIIVGITGLVLLCIAVAVLVNPQILPADMLLLIAPRISDDVITSEIQDYYDNDLTISVDLRTFGLGIVPIPAKDYFQVSNIQVMDKSVSGNEATIVASITFTMEEIDHVGSGTWDYFLNYFGSYDFVSQTFEQERKFLFRQYESGTWRFERELITE